MDFRFLREPTVPNFEGEFAVEEEGDSVPEEGNACPFFLAGVLGALAAGVDGEETSLGVDVGAAPLVDGFATSVAAGVATGSITGTGEADAGSGETAATAGSEMGSEAATSVVVGSEGASATATWVVFDS